MKSSMIKVILLLFVYFFVSVKAECDSGDNKCMLNGACVSTTKFNLRPSSDVLPINCVKTCADNECFHPTLFKCVATTTDILAVEKGLSCMCKEESTRKCIDPTLSSNFCITPTSGKVSNEDGLECTTTCLNKNKCINGQFICQSPTDQLISPANASTCIAVNDVTSLQCFHPVLFVISNLFEGVIQSTSKSCKCVNDNANEPQRCFSRTKFRCNVTSFRHLANDENGGECVTSCTGTKCFTSSIDGVRKAFVCYDPLVNRISNNDGSVCSATSCKDKNSCYNNSFVCVNTGSITILGDGSSCSGTCPSGKCKSSATNRCISPVNGSFLQDSQNNCATQCPAATCLHPIRLKCLPVTTTYENVDARSDKTCICVNKVKCLDPSTDACIDPIDSKISDGDGSLCKVNTCSDKTKCINKLTFNCVKSNTNPVEFKALINDGGECYCTDSEKCLDNSNTCVVASSGKIAEGDGSYCRATNCTNKNKCVSNFNCLDLNSTTPRISNGDGGNCLSACPSGKCYNSSTLHCMTPKNGFVLKEDIGGACSNNICSSNKCWNPNNFQCMDIIASPFDPLSDTTECRCPTDNCVKSDNTCDTIDSTTSPKRLSVSSTKKCLPKCPVGMCYHPLNGICKSISSSIYTVTEGGECLCVNKSHCLSRTALDPDYSCISPNSTNIANGDGSLCETDTLGCADKTKCYITTGDTPYKCMAASISFISKNDGKECATVVNNSIDPNLCVYASVCLNEVNYNCQEPNLIDNMDDNVKAAYCECDSEYCIHPTSSSCVKPTTLFSTTNIINDTVWKRKCKTISEGCSGSQCIIPQSNSSHADFRKCMSIGSGVILENSKYCMCEDLNKCFDLTTNTCITPTTNKISDGDGSVCKRKCSNPLFCFNPVTFLCQNPEDFSFKKVSSGSECICTNSQQCIDTDGVCKSASLTRISDNNGTICKAKCTNTKKCYNSNYLCIDGQESNIVDDDQGGSCKTTCSTTTKCYHPSTFICQTPGTGMDSTTIGDKCKCTTTSECIRNNATVCSVGAVESGITYYSNNDGYQCVNLCSNLNNCIDNNLCITPTTNKYSLGDGKICVSTCPSTQCLSNSICINPTPSLLLVAGSTDCKATCQLSQCRHPSKNQCLSTTTNFVASNPVDDPCVCDPSSKCIDNDTCITPVLGKLSNNSNGSICISECPENFCIHPTTFKCTAVSADLISENGYCVCSNKAKCLDDNICIVGEDGKFSYGDGGLCTNLNYDSDDNSSLDAFRCKDLTKCVENFTCITPTTAKISRNNGLACQTSCISDDCYHPSTFVCQNKNTYLMESSTAGGVCKCVNKKHCIDSTSKWCIASQLGKHVISTEGELCGASCGVDKCYDEITNICHSGSPSVIINSDGAVCATSCLDVSKCYSPVNFKCITPTIVMNSSPNGQICKCVDDVADCLIDSITCSARSSSNCSLKSWYEKAWVKSFGNTTVNSVTTSYALIESVKMNTTISSPSTHSDITSKLYYVERSAKNTSPETSIEITTSVNGEAQYSKYLIDIYGFSPLRSYVAWDIKVFLYTNQGVEIGCFTNGVAHLIQYKIKFFRNEALATTFYNSIGNEVDKIRSYYPSEFRSLDVYHNKISDSRKKDTGSQFATDEEVKNIFLKGPSYLDAC